MHPLRSQPAVSTSASSRPSPCHGPASYPRAWHGSNADATVLEPWRFGQCLKNLEEMPDPDMAPSTILAFSLATAVAGKVWHPPQRQPLTSPRTISPFRSVQTPPPFHLKPWLVHFQIQYCMYIPVRWTRTIEIAETHFAFQVASKMGSSFSDALPCWVAWGPGYMCIRKR